jgi:hypothetical protein
VLLLNEVVLQTCFVCMRRYLHSSGRFGFIVKRAQKVSYLDGELGGKPATPRKE